MKRLLIVVAVAAFFFSVHRVEAQEASAPPAELNKIGYLVGTWKVEATGYSPTGGTPTKTNLTFENEWMKGHFF